MLMTRVFVVDFESNEKRKEEVKDKAAKGEVKKVAARAVASEKALAGEKNESAEPQQCG